MMLLLILKSSARLAVLTLFYKLCLEKTSAHTLKRFYLIGAVTISIVIPFITFTTYVEVEPINVLSTSQPFENSSTEFTEITQPVNYLPIILWSIYALGAILFLFRFFKNLHQLIQKTNNNLKYKNRNIIHVLITDLITPHTFFNYIFLNKTKFENNQIPEEVLLHEETHATQKHSFDVLFIEILQIIFWFNPIIYFIKQSIKLNHEFLADQAVIKHGVTPSTYQQILLAFSSNASEPQLANAINYSSIKKRFTVMKTHTTKRGLWLRSLLLLPLLAFLIYGFSEKEVIETPYVLQKNIDKENEIKIFINQNRKVLINNTEIEFNNLAKTLIEITKNIKNSQLNKPFVYVEIKGYVTNSYMEEIKNEIKKSNLEISVIQATSISINENQFDKETENYFKRTQFTADTMQFITKNGDTINGFSGPIIIEKNNEQTKPSTDNSITIKLPKDYIVNSNDLIKVDDYIKGLIKNKEEKTVSKKNNQQSTTIGLFITIKDHETVSIKSKNYTLENFEYYLSDLIKTINSNEKLSPVIISDCEDDDVAVRKVQDILRKHKLLKINTKMNISYKDNIVNITEQKANLKEIEEYNDLAKKFNTNPEGIFKGKDIKRVIELYNLMSDEQKKDTEPFPKFTPPLEIPENATPEEIKMHNKRYGTYKELTKDLKK